MPRRFWGPVGLVEIDATPGSVLARIIRCEGIEATPLLRVDRRGPFGLTVLTLNVPLAWSLPRSGRIVR